MGRGRKRNRDIPEELTELVVASYVVQGRSLQDIAAEHEVTQYVLTKFLLANDVKIKRRGRRDGFKPTKQMEMFPTEEENS